MAHIIAVYCGHGTQTDGSSDCGTIYAGENEAALMLPITKAAVKDLRSSGVKVYTDADKSNNINMIKQVAEANRVGAELFVSIHCDYYKAPTGTMPLYVSDKGKNLAGNINANVMTSLGIASRGVTKRTDLYELNATDMPACVFETGSIKEDLQLLKTRSDDYGKAIAGGILTYLGMSQPEYEPPAKPPTKPQAGRTISSVYSADKNLTVKEAVKAGQALSNILLDTAIAEDGIYGTDTKRNSVKVLQWAINKDYSAGLNIDGIYGQETSKALGYHNVRFDEVQYMVTALQVLLLLNGYNPHGVEIPGDFGGGCRKATKDFQSDAGITVDGIAGRNTFLELIEA